MLPYEPRHGQWYISAVCSQCTQRIILFRDLSDGKSELKGSFVFDCPYCEYRGTYQAEHYRHDRNLNHTALRAVAV
jgi:DNA-directed RNA polymerase subunit RPC12/RpoP